MFSASDGPLASGLIGYLMFISKLLSGAYPGDFAKKVASRDVECLRKLHPGENAAELFGMVKLNGRSRSERFNISEGEYVELCRMRFGLAASQ